MRLPGRDNDQWYWADASPVARAVVWAGVDGAYLPMETLYDAMHEGFGVSADELTRQLGRLGNGCIINDVVDRLQELEPDALQSVTAELVTLAGDSDDSSELATKAYEGLTGSDVDEAREALRGLSAVAADRIAKTGRRNKGWRKLANH